MGSFVVRSIATILSNVSLTVVFSRESLAAAAIRAPGALMLGQRFMLEAMLGRILG